MDDVVDVRNGGLYNHAFKTDGSIWTWGITNLAPVLLIDGVESVDFSNMRYTKPDGSVWFWAEHSELTGWYVFGEGDPVQVTDDLDDSDVPGDLVGMDNMYDQSSLGNLINEDDYISIREGYIHVEGREFGTQYKLGLKEDGSLWGWSNEINDIILIMEDVDKFVGNHNLVKRDGTFWVWDIAAVFMVGWEEARPFIPIQVIIRVES
jgi:alpha-tubulin suppressor-like RCC1 family protein